MEWSDDQNLNMEGKGWQVHEKGRVKTLSVASGSGRFLQIKLPSIYFLVFGFWVYYVDNRMSGPPTTGMLGASGTSTESGSMIGT